MISLSFSAVRHPKFYLWKVTIGKAPLSSAQVLSGASALKEPRPELQIRDTDWVEITIEGVPGDVANKVLALLDAEEAEGRL